MNDKDKFKKHFIRSHEDFSDEDWKLENQFLRECQEKARHRGDTVMNVLHLVCGIAFGGSVVLLVIMYLKMSADKAPF